MLENEKQTTYLQTCQGVGEGRKPTGLSYLLLSV